MLSASELRPGMAVRLEGALYKVIAAEYHLGGGKMGGVTHAKLRNLTTGAAREWRFRGEEPVDLVELERRPMQFLYQDADSSYFMHPQTFEQVGIENDRLGAATRFLREGASVTVEFFDGAPTSVLFPESVEVRVAETTPPIHAIGTTNVWKEARLENGLVIQVPPFIAPGEMIRVRVEPAAYLERAKGERRP